MVPPHAAPRHSRPEPAASGPEGEQPQQQNTRLAGQTIDREGAGALVDRGQLPLSLTLWGLGLACAATWLLLLLATNFSMVVVALGLLVGLAIVR